MSGSQRERRRPFPRRRPAPVAGAQGSRVEALDALLRGVDELRLTLETDLTLAASAVEAGHPGVAVEILDSDRASLASFESGALSELAALGDDEIAARRRLRVPAHSGPVLVAAALVGLLAGTAPQLLHPSAAGPNARSVAATNSLEHLRQVAETGDTNQIRAASLQLHAQLAGVVAQAHNDPQAAQTALLLLSYEQSTIVSNGDSHALADVLRQSRALVSAIFAALPRPVHSVAPLVVMMPEARAAEGPKHESKSKAEPAKPTPTRSPSASPKAKPTASPSPSGSPSPSSSPSNEPGPLPKPPLSP